MTESTSSMRLSNVAVYLFVPIVSAPLFMTLMIAPILAVKIASQFDLTATQVGLLFSLELGAFSLATLPAYFWLGKLDARRATYLFGGLALLGNLTSTVATNFALLLAARTFTALAAGSVAVIALALAGKAGNPGRAFGLFIFMQVVLGAVVLSVFPAIFEPVPVSAIYVTMAILIAVSLPITQMLPAKLSIAEHGQPTEGTAKASPVRYLVALAAVLLFYIGAAAAWTFIALPATEAGLGLDTITTTLAIATFVGLIPSLFASILGDTKYNGLIIVVSFVGALAGIYLLIGLTAAVAYIASSILFQFAWNLLLPYLFSMVAATNSSPRVTSTINLMAGGGLAIGPVAAGALLESTGSVEALLWASMAFIAAGLGSAAYVLARRAPALSLQADPIAVKP
ncbi:MFS transporter [Paenarthrobacter nicotinovorans]|uniref:MFS transporter n=1 Tax=Paenarthrobacter nicotinovorans TaxID=29320 RepID=UPI003DA68CC2